MLQAAGFKAQADRPTVADEIKINHTSVGLFARPDSVPGGWKKLRVAECASSH